MSKYNEKYASKETGSSEKDVQRAWHDARDDAAASGDLGERNAFKTSDSREGGLLYGLLKAIGVVGRDDE